MGKANEAQYCMVRIRVDTRQALRDIARKWQTMAQSQGVAVPYSADDRWDVASVDSLIRELLRRDQDHRDRARNSRAKKGKAAPKAPPRVDPPFPPSEQS